MRAERRFSSHAGEFREGRIVSSPGQARCRGRRRNQGRRCLVEGGAPLAWRSARRILEVDPTLATVRAATTGKSADLSLDDIEFDPVIREPHATWALALNYKLHIEETGLTTSPDYPQIFLRMPICQVGHKV